MNDRHIFGWSYPPGVTGNEPQINGVSMIACQHCLTEYDEEDAKYNMVKLPEGQWVCITHILDATVKATVTFAEGEIELIKLVDMPAMYNKKCMLCDNDVEFFDDDLCSYCQAEED